MNTKRIAITLVGIGAIAMACALGQWQMRRASAKEALEARLDRASRGVATMPAAIELADPSSLIDRRIVLRGHWRPERVVYLDHRPQAGRIGFHVLMALHITKPIDAEVVVNRGWLPGDAADRQRVGPYVTPGDEVEVSGLVLDRESRVLELGKDVNRRFGGIWQNLDFATFARLSGVAPLAIVVRQEPGSIAPDGRSSDGLDRRWPEREGVLQAQIDRHHGYAFQWFALAFTFAILLVVQTLRSSRHVAPDAS